MRRALRSFATAPNVVGVVGAILAAGCLLALPSSPQPWNIRIPLYLMLALWTILRPRIALYALPIAIPWASLDSISVGSFQWDTAAADLPVALLLLGWLLSFVVRPYMGRVTNSVLDYERTEPMPHGLVLATLLLLLAMLLSITTTHSISASLKELVKWIEVVILLLLGARYLHTRQQVWTLVIVVLLAGVSQGLLGLVQAFFQLGPQAFVRASELRVYGTFGQPNPFGGYINLILTISIALLLLGRDTRTRLLAGCAVIVLGIAEYLSQSKGGYIAIAVAIYLILTLGFPRLRPLMYAIIIALVAAIGGYMVGLVPARYTTPILQKIGLIDISFYAPSAANYANSERVAHWLAGINMFLDHPFLGVGIGNYASVYPHYALGIFVLPLGHAHNYYINIAAEAGIVGLTAFVLFIAAIFVAGGRAYRSISGRYMQAKAKWLKPTAPTSTREAWHTAQQVGALKNDRALAIGILAALLSVCVHNLVDNLYVHSMSSLFALLLVALIRLDGVTSKVGTNGG